jgi:hypothetical protein
MSWRKLVVDDLTYFWKCGQTVVEIRGPDEQGCGNMTMDRPKVEDVIGTTVGIVERGRWKGTTDGMVTPRLVSEFIGKHPIHVENKKERKKELLQ